MCCIIIHFSSVALLQWENTSGVLLHFQHILIYSFIVQGIERAEWQSLYLDSFVLYQQPHLL